MKVKNLKQTLLSTLTEDILPYWITNMIDQENGGFYGRISADNTVHPEAEKGAVLNARILWTFSAAYRILKEEKYLDVATRAKEYIINHFYDQEHGGIYWSVDYLGAPLNTKKQFYALGFAIYGLSEFHRATGDKESLDYAIKLFQSIEKYSFDHENNGYIEACAREWEKIDDMRLSEKDENEKKTMNTHLHILEPYTNLYRVWKNDNLRIQLENLIDIFLEKILNTNTGHLGLFFDENWNIKSSDISYGHDIEASWLLLEAAEELKKSTTNNNEALKNAAKIRYQKVLEATKEIANAAMEGYQKDGSLIYETYSDGRVDTDRHWWVQNETVIGLYYQYKYHQSEKALDMSIKTLNYYTENMIDKENGECFWSINNDGEINKTDDKAGFWKCPYHNSRMCLEIIEN